jgi:hypothetical protein
MLPLINPVPFLWLLLVLVVVLLVGAIAFFLGVLKGKEIEAGLQKRSQKLLRSILGGVFSEQIAPFLPDFPKDLRASEARFIGKPIDFLIFKGMDEQHINEVVFVEIKTGNSQLSSNERTLRDAIEAKRVRWHEHRIDHAISNLPAPAAPEQAESRPAPTASQLAARSSDTPAPSPSVGSIPDLLWARPSRSRTMNTALPPTAGTRSTVRATRATTSAPTTCAYSRRGGSRARSKTGTRTPSILRACATWSGATSRQLRSSFPAGTRQRRRHGRAAKSRTGTD